MHKYFLHIGIATAIALFFALLFIHPWFMPGPWTMIIATALIVLVGVFLGLLWWERESEAKDQVLALLPDRAALFASLGVIVVAILFESSLRETDPWLFAALGAALVARAAAKWYRVARTKKSLKEKKEK